MGSQIYNKAKVLIDYCVQPGKTGLHPHPACAALPPKQKRFLALFLQNLYCWKHHRSVCVVQCSSILLYLRPHIKSENAPPDDGRFGALTTVWQSGNRFRDFLRTATVSLKLGVRFQVIGSVICNTVAKYMFAAAAMVTSTRT